MSEPLESPRLDATALHGHVRLEDALRKLSSTHDGDLGVIDAVTCGPIAIPALRAILFNREPSGLYETRRRAVEALARLRAFDVLTECLTLISSRETTDPVEQTGDEAVMNAVARALVEADDARARSILLDIAKRRLMAGVVEALGALHCREAITYFIGALADDFTRPAGEAAIRTIGPSARPALMEVVISRVPPGQREYMSRIRQRCSALALVAEFGLTADMRPTIYALMDDETPNISVLACEISLSCGPTSVKHQAIRRLISLTSADWRLSQEIIDALATNITHAKPIIEDIVAHLNLRAEFETKPDQVRETLLRILAQAGSGAKGRE